MNSDERSKLELELLALTTIKKALDRRDEVFQIIDDAPDESAARERLAKLLDVDEDLCSFIFQLQVSAWFGTWRDRVAAQAETLRTKLGADAPQP
ncbi:hypothetical protein ACFY5D_20815 [Paeniglutamicibacter sp. NPDC012692]|uniref:hypothetical protein n=1 Tax=Paeniglutamicibacter sp. NPDC012692 TaxID=3364388 RepID=UPI0036B8CB5E